MKSFVSFILNNLVALTMKNADCWTYIFILRRLIMCCVCKRATANDKYKKLLEKKLLIQKFLKIKKNKACPTLHFLNNDNRRAEERIIEKRARKTLRNVYALLVLPQNHDRKYALEVGQ